MGAPMAGKRELLMFQVEIDDDGIYPETGCVGRMECPDPRMVKGDQLGCDFLQITNRSVLEHLQSQVQGAMRLCEELDKQEIEAEVPPWLLELVIIEAYTPRHAVEVLKGLLAGQIVETVA